MFKHYFEGIENIEWAPIISLLIFFVFFILMIIGIFKMDKRFINKMKQLPMDDSKPADNNFERITKK